MKTYSPEIVQALKNVQTSMEALSTLAVLGDTALPPEDYTALGQCYRTVSMICEKAKGTKP